MASQGKIAALAGVALGLLSGVVTLVTRTKKLASEHLDQDGAYKEIRDTRRQQISELLHKPIENIRNIDRQYPDKTSPYQSKIVKINRQFFAAKDQINRREHIGSFHGAWNTLKGSEKTTTLGFASLVGVGVGAITYLIGNSVGKGGSGAGLDDWDDSYGYGYGGFDFFDGGGIHM